MTNLNDKSEYIEFEINNMIMYPTNMFLDDISHLEGLYEKRGAKEEFISFWNSFRLRHKMPNIGGDVDEIKRLLDKIYSKSILKNYLKQRVLPIYISDDKYSKKAKKAKCKQKKWILALNFTLPILTIIMLVMTFILEHFNYKDNNIYSVLLIIGTATYVTLIVNLFMSLRNKYKENKKSSIIKIKKRINMISENNTAVLKSYEDRDVNLELLVCKYLSFNDKISNLLDEKVYLKTIKTFETYYLLCDFIQNEKFFYDDLEKNFFEKNNFEIFPDDKKEKIHFNSVIMYSYILRFESELEEAEISLSL